MKENNFNLPSGIRSGSHWCQFYCPTQQDLTSLSEVKPDPWPCCSLGQAEAACGWKKHTPKAPFPASLQAREPSSKRRTSKSLQNPAGTSGHRRSSADPFQWVQGGGSSQLRHKIFMIFLKQLLMLQPKIKAIKAVSLNSQRSVETFPIPSVHVAWMWSQRLVKHLLRNHKNPSYKLKYHFLASNCREHLSSMPEYVIICCSSVKC